MSKKDEALKLALENICAAKLCEFNSMSSRHEMIRLMDAAITAIGEALAHAPEVREQPVRPYRLLQDNGSKYFGASWDKAEPTTTENNGGKTGWPAGMLQDDDKRLSKWLASKPDARQKVREALAEQPAQDQGQSCYCPECERLSKELDDARQSLDFYRRRINALQQWQSKMRDPERTIVCDIIANGLTLEPAGDRYKLAEQPAQQEPVAWQILNGVCHAGVRSTENLAKEAAAGMQKTHDLGGSLAAFHVRPLYTSPPASKPLTDKACTWARPDSDHMPDTWEAACGAMWTFTDGGPKDNNMHFCPNCGKPAIEAAHGIKD